MSRSDPTDDVLAAIASIFDKSDAPLVADHAIRFKWTARRDDNGEYFVDETIGTQSRIMSTGPMAEDEVIAFVDNRVHEARDRFDKLKSDMTIQPADPAAARIAVERAHVEHDASEDQGS